MNQLLVPLKGDRVPQDEGCDGRQSLEQGYFLCKVLVLWNTKRQHSSDTGRTCV